MENIEDIKYHNRVWYLKTYEALILKAQTENIANSENYFENHHILPKCIGGTDENSNLVLLNSRQHIIAHMLLSCMYPENISLCNAVIAMTMISRYTKDRVRFPTRLLAIFREEYAKLQKGKTLTKEHREKLSKAKIGRKRKDFSEETKKKISEGKRGKTFGTRVIDPKGVIYSSLSECSKVYEVSQSTIHFWITKSPEKGFKFYNGDGFKLHHPRARKIQGPNGEVYESLTDCSIRTNHDRHTISRWIKNKPEKGFKYI